MEYQDEQIHMEYKEKQSGVPCKKGLFMEYQDKQTYMEYQNYFFSWLEDLHLATARYASI